MARMEQGMTKPGLAVGSAASFGRPPRVPALAPCYRATPGGHAIAGAAGQHWATRWAGRRGARAG